MLTKYPSAFEFSKKKKNAFFDFEKKVTGKKSAETDDVEAKKWLSADTTT